MTTERQPPESVAAFLKVAPEALSDAMVVLSAAVSLTDELAFALLDKCWHHDISVKTVLGVLRTSDFAIQRNSEWHIENHTRDFFLHELHSNPSLEASAHALLAGVASGEEQGVATGSIPVYISWPVGRAYHSAVADPQLGLRLYADAYNGRATGDQWLLGELADEQQRNGLLPADAIEPAFLRGMAAYREGRLQDAETALRRVAASRQIRLEVGIAQHVLGILVHRRRHQRDEAIALLRRSLEIGAQLNNTRHQAHVLTTLGRTLAQEGSRTHLEEAISCFESSLDLGMELRDVHHQAVALNGLGSAMLRLGERPRLKMAREYFERSFRLNEEAGDVPGQVECLNSIGTALVRLGEPSDLAAAVEVFERSLRLSQQSDDTLHQAFTLNGLGNALMRLGDARSVRRAIESFEESVNLGEQLKNPLHQAMALNNLGQARQLIDEPEQLERAQAEFAQSLQLLEELGDLRGQAMVHSRMAGLAKKRGNIPGATEHLEKAIAIDEKLGHTKYANRLRLELLRLQKRP